MCILNICKGEAATFYFTKQPEPELVRKIQIIDGLQEKDGLENKPVSGWLSRISIGLNASSPALSFFHGCNGSHHNNTGLRLTQ